MTELNSVLTEINRFKQAYLILEKENRENRDRLGQEIAVKNELLAEKNSLVNESENLIEKNKELAEELEQLKANNIEIKEKYLEDLKADPYFLEYQSLFSLG